MTELDNTSATFEPIKRTEKSEKLADNLAEKKQNVVNDINSNEFTIAAEQWNVSRQTIQSLFNHIDSNHDGLISVQDRDNALNALDNRMTQLMDRINGEFDDEEHQYEDDQESIGFISKMLEQLIQDTQNKQIVDELNTLQEKLYSEGLTPDLIQKTVELFTKLAPPIDIKA